MSEELVFTCPKCGKHRLEEIQQGVCVASEICHISDDDLTVLYGEQTNEGGVVERYQCGHCGWVLKDSSQREITNEDDLVSLLVKMKNDNLVTHDKLVDRIADAHRELGGHEMAELWNEIFPNEPIAYKGDSIYVWDKDAENAPS